MHPIRASPHGAPWRSIGPAQCGRVFPQVVRSLGLESGAAGAEEGGAWDKDRMKYAG